LKPLINKKRQFIFLISSLLITCLISSNAYAFHWQDLWTSPDQQAAELLEEGQAEQAAQRFHNNDWRGVANYRAGQYEQAKKDFSQENTALSLYNQGNALAQLGEYQTAIEAYNEALKQDPNNKDAIFNRVLLEELLEQQENQPNEQQDQQQDQQENDDQQQSSDQQEQPDAQNDQQQEDNQQQQADQSEQENKDGQDQTDQQQNDKQQQEPQQTEQQREQQQSQEQWLRRVPDDPGGLLRQKFLRDHLRKNAG